MVIIPDIPFEAYKKEYNQINVFNNGIYFGYSSSKKGIQWKRGK